MLGRLEILISIGYGWHAACRCDMAGRPRAYGVDIATARAPGAMRHARHRTAPGQVRRGPGSEARTACGLRLASIAGSLAVLARSAACSACSSVAGLGGPSVRPSSRIACGPKPARSRSIPAPACQQPSSSGDHRFLSAFLSISQNWALGTSNEILSRNQAAERPAASQSLAENSSFGKRMSLTDSSQL